MTLIEKHQNYMTFLKDNDMLTPERKKTIVSQIDSVFNIMNVRSNKRIREDDESSDSNSVS